MKRIICILTGMIFLVLVDSGFACAGVWGRAKDLVTGEVLALAVSALLAILGASLGLVFRKISRTFREVGEFMTTVGLAIEDRRITRDELANIIKEGKDIFESWK